MIREIFNSIMGEGKYIGRRFIFVRFAGCPLNCVYCDEESKGYFNRVEKIPGSGEFETLQKMEIEDIINAIDKLKTPDLFAVSFTGGEPLLYHKQIKEIAEILKDKGYRTFLESNGMFPERIFYFDIASIDIKLKEHFEYIKDEDYEKLYKNELKTIKKLYNLNSDIYAKVVIMEETNIEDVKIIAKDLSDIGNITLCIQPVTPHGNIKSPSQRKLFEIMEACGEYLKDNVMLTIQMHKYLGML
ncbi:TPA: 7-carboxy-7-deazaguanine synthase QueE [Methanocaldococcus jannaschii]|uniref:7-carboxy-7-deazaguanine synthase n=2 Tax=Methanocaldococcus jannaschii TaxID=2190 RepID=QUEE_METJA|nr:7-carboxy-7-deazaguanine synthase QueE [Methanocaldococcus jannaschii]Q59039.1 RecName: Full=7-carboxy-7-deazaguanine synthase; Short=CDG synthase; AltName: Full=Archaeosine biosynthesis protein QueE [Methanocaldococcus jannaschii DSM 2661]AAB99666.1 coenzyme PQQ synthesis protein III isolog (Haemophilus influenzae} [Methanocaldococcus jannaschii DSM 2661]HII59411.1 7-carboxy-7-deazaguanine synthase QueE [Methanocaldococcus jannaschii]